MKNKETLSFDKDTKFTEKKVDLPKEMVNSPAHYGGKDNPYEAIKVIEAWGLDFCLGNVVKYIARVGKKDDSIQELQKAKWYLDRKIQQLEDEQFAIVHKALGEQIMKEYKIRESKIQSSKKKK